MGNLHTTHLIHAFTVLIPYHTAPITEVVSTALITVNNHWQQSNKIILCS